MAGVGKKWRTLVTKGRAWLAIVALSASLAAEAHAQPHTWVGAGASASLDRVDGLVTVDNGGGWVSSWVELTPHIFVGGRLGVVSGTDVAYTETQAGGEALWVFRRNRNAFRWYVGYTALRAQRVTSLFDVVRRVVVEDRSGVWLTGPSAGVLLGIGGTRVWLRAGATVIGPGVGGLSGPRRTQGDVGFHVRF